MSARMPPDASAPVQPSAADRLARSRAALASAMHHRGRNERDERDDLGPEWGQSESDQPARRGGGKRRGWWPLARSLAATWWHRHPLNTLVHVAEPALSAYAKKQPVRLLGIAALAGAAIVIVRPWRLISAGALLAAALRPSEISAFAMSMLASFNNAMDDDDDSKDSNDDARRRQP